MYIRKNEYIYECGRMEDEWRRSCRLVAGSIFWVILGSKAVIVVWNTMNYNTACIISYEVCSSSRLYSQYDFFIFWPREIFSTFFGTLTCTHVTVKWYHVWYSMYVIFLSFFEWEQGLFFSSISTFVLREWWLAIKRGGKLFQIGKILKKYEGSVF